MDRHHLRVHAERDVGLVSAAGALAGLERIARLRVTLLLLGSILLLLHLLLQLSDSGPVQAALGDPAMLERPAFVPGAVVVVPLADDLAAAHDNATMAVVEGGLRSLLEAERQVVVGLHRAVGTVLLGGANRYGVR